MASIIFDRLTYRGIDKSHKYYDFIVTYVCQFIIRKSLERPLFKRGAVLYPELIILGIDCVLDSIPEIIYYTPSCYYIDNIYPYYEALKNDIVPDPQKYYPCSNHSISTGWSSIMRSVLMNDIESIKDHIHQINTRNDNGWTPLLLAVGNPQWSIGETIEVLLSKGADVNITNSEGFSALLFALIDGNTELCHRLIELGAYLVIETVNGLNPLFCLDNLRDPLLSTMIIKYNAFRINKSYRGVTPIFCALRDCEASIVIELLEYGADIQHAYEYYDQLVGTLIGRRDDNLVKDVLSYIDPYRRDKEGHTFGWYVLDSEYLKIYTERYPDIGLFFD